MSNLTEPEGLTTPGKPPHVQELLGHAQTTPTCRGEPWVPSEFPVLSGLLGHCPPTSLSMDLPPPNQVLSFLSPEQDCRVYYCAPGTLSQWCPWETNVLGLSMLEVE